MGATSEDLLCFFAKPERPPEQGCSLNLSVSNKLLGLIFCEDEKELELFGKMEYTVEA